MEFRKLVTLERICFLPGATKKEALDKLISLVAPAGAGADLAAMKQGLLHREELMSTGIGLGIAVPHVRLENISEFILAVGLSREGIADYEAIDDEPIRIVILIIAVKSQHKEYLQLLSQLVKLLKQDAVRKSILNAATTAEVYEILTKG